MPIAELGRPRAATYLLLEPAWRRAQQTRYPMRHALKQGRGVPRRAHPAWPCSAKGVAWPRGDILGPQPLQSPQLAGREAASQPQLRLRALLHHCRRRRQHRGGRHRCGHCTLDRGLLLLRMLWLLELGSYGEGSPASGACACGRPCRCRGPRGSRGGGPSTVTAEKAAVAASPCRDGTWIISADQVQLWTRHCASRSSVAPRQLCSGSASMKAVTDLWEPELVQPVGSCWRACCQTGCREPSGCTGAGAPSPSLLLPASSAHHGGESQRRSCRCDC